ncbi:DUF3237 domain-containing protein [Halioxenophilus aromaticivorans]|uniref:UPF0311 protein GCM10025791_22820 n=1 Tax=Halioxenophilus aromaticivorans TaxID=1306992 RepID=A0AAV3U2D2_9ALTE
MPKLTITTALCLLATTLAVNLTQANDAKVETPPTAEPYLEFAFEEIVTLANAMPVGTTGLGKRNIIPITGGRFYGDKLKGEILPGGWDWQLQRADGCTLIEADYMLKTDDGVIINVLNKGTLCQMPGKGFSARTHPVFEVPVGKYDWLNKTTFIGTLEPAPKSEGPAVKIKFYAVK